MDAEGGAGNSCCLVSSRCGPWEFAGPFKYRRKMPCTNGDINLFPVNECSANEVGIEQNVPDQGQVKTSASVAKVGSDQGHEMTSANFADVGSAHGREMSSAIVAEVGLEQGQTSQGKRAVSVAAAIAEQRQLADPTGKATTKAQWEQRRQARLARREERKTLRQQQKEERRREREKQLAKIRAQQSEARLVDLTKLVPDGLEPHEAVVRLLECSLAAAQRRRKPPPGVPKGIVNNFAPTCCQGLVLSTEKDTRPNIENVDLKGIRKKFLLVQKLLGHMEQDLHSEKQRLASAEATTWQPMVGEESLERLEQGRRSMLSAAVEGKGVEMVAASLCPVPAIVTDQLTDSLRSISEVFVPFLQQQCGQRRAPQEATTDGEETKEAHVYTNTDKLLARLLL